MYLIIDLLYALRLLRKTPKFTALAISVLIGGLSVALFTFAFLYTFLYKPLPLPEQDSLYKASLHWVSDVKGEAKYFPAYELSQIRGKLASFDEFGSWQNVNVNVAYGEDNRVTSGVRTEWNVFNVSRTPAIMGRTLQQSDSVRGEEPVAVISYSMWQNQFAGIPDIVGTTVSVNEVLTTIVGVMPQGYKFPESHDIWLPMTEALLNPGITSKETVEFYGRLKDGVSVEQAERELYGLAADVFQSRAAQVPGTELIRSEVGIYQQFDLPTTFKQMSKVLIGISLLILLLACINVGNLLFARAIQRNKETAIRSALGATQWRLIVQQMLEGVVITVVGTVISIALVAWLLKVVDVAMHSMLGNELQFWYQWEMDMAVVLAAVGFMLFTIFAACFLPAWRAATQDFNAVLKDGTKGAQGKKIGKLSRVMVTLQIMVISIIMLFGAILSVKVHQLTDFDMGVDAHNLFYTEMELPDKLYPTKESYSTFYSILNQRLEQESEYVGTLVRFNFKRLRVAIDGTDYAKESDKPRISVYSIIGNPEFMSPRLIEGRFVDRRDTVESDNTVVVSQSMAQRYWPGTSPLGKRIQITLDETPTWFRVVGVGSNISRTPLEKPHQYDEVYISGLQHPMAAASVYFEFKTSGENAESVFFRVLASVDSQLDVANLEDYAHEMGVVVKMTTTIRDTIIICGAFALLLAISGIYGLTSFAVTKRTHEVGIRRALGCTDSQVIWLFGKQGGRQLAIGLGLGVALASLFFAATSRFLALPGYVYVMITLSVISLLVCIIMSAIIIPTRSAVKLEPSAALRYE